MMTSKSPRKVLKLAHELAQRALPEFDSRFSRHDFTNAQLFACLVLREHQRKSFRGVEALLVDSPAWLADIGLRKVPDHNTLCRAFDRFVRPELAWTMLDLMAQLAQQRGTIKRNRGKPLTIDSSLFESRHVSRHFERRQRDTTARSAKKARVRGAKRSIAADDASSAACPSSRWRATAPRT
jgi:hypothetical protein